MVMLHIQGLKTHSHIRIIVTVNDSIMCRLVQKTWVNKKILHPVAAYTYRIQPLRQKHLRKLGLKVSERVLSCETGIELVTMCLCVEATLKNKKISLWKDKETAKMEKITNISI
ncbi:MAG: hypothetical protein ACQZ3M_02850 [cyanobacterium endosymbiont of Rhopalodia fuxianensis]